MRSSRTEPTDNELVSGERRFPTSDAHTAEGGKKGEEGSLIRSLSHDSGAGERMDGQAEEMLLLLRAARKLGS